jgi:hypothetical protein
MQHIYLNALWIGVLQDDNISASICNVVWMVLSGGLMFGS